MRDARGRINALREQNHPLARELRPEAATTADGANHAAAAANFERTIAKIERPKAKALLRLLIKQLRVNGRSEILPTYRAFPQTLLEA